MPDHDITLKPGKIPVPATTRLTNHRNDVTKYPTEGRRYGVLYLMAKAGKVQEALALVQQLRALCDDSWMTHGVADSDDDMRTSVHVQVTQIPNVPLE